MDERELNNLKERLMNNQLNQHFIFNALNTIKCAVITDQRQACSLVDDFAKYLRYNLNIKEQSGVVSFRREMEQVRAYANIEMARFSKLNVEYDLREEDFYLPPMSIQPLVENAVIYGICSSREGGTVSIRSYLKEGYYQIEIADNGCGFVPEQIQSQKTKTGSIENIRIRLEELTQGRLLVKSHRREGTRILLQIPEESARKLHIPKEGQI